MRPLTRIHQIEVTTRCNLACVYCPHPKMQREKRDMDWETFERAMQWVLWFSGEIDSNQKELSFTGIGEALLHPEFELMLKTARALYDGYIHFSTNGILFDEHWARVCAELNIGVYVSMHRPEKAALAAKLAKDYGVLADTNHGFAINAMDWAGQVNWYVSARPAPCEYQRQGWGVVMVDGSVTTCCMDSEGTNVLGHVDDKLGSINMAPKPLCGQCYLEV